jgi:hypothetical protein
MPRRRPVVVVAGALSVSGCGPVDAGPMAVANEGGHVVVHAPVCHGRLTDIFVTVGDDVAHPLVWHHMAIRHDLSVDLTAPAPGWQGPTLTLSPTTTYSVGGGNDVVFSSDSRGSDVWAGDVEFTGAEVLALPEGEMIVSWGVPFGHTAGATIGHPRMSRADFYAAAC